MKNNPGLYDISTVRFWPKIIYVLPAGLSLTGPILCVVPVRHTQTHTEMPYRHDKFLTFRSSTGQPAATAVPVRHCRRKGWGGGQGKGVGGGGYTQDSCHGKCAISLLAASWVDGFCISRTWTFGGCRFCVRAPVLSALIWARKRNVTTAGTGASQLVSARIQRLTSRVRDYSSSE